MMQVLFKDGQTIAINTAIEVKYEGGFWPEPVGALIAPNPLALVCVDAQGKEVARFVHSEIRGFVIEETAL